MLNHFISVICGAGTGQDATCQPRNIMVSFRVWAGHTRCILGHPGMATGVLKLILENMFGQKLLIITIFEFWWASAESLHARTQNTVQEIRARVA